MRKIVNATNVSLDGLIDNMEDWHFQYFSDESTAFQQELLESADSLLMGRKTYEGFAEAWPQRSGDPFSDKFNAMPKFVASTTLTDPAWNNTTVLEGDLVEAVRKLKESDGGDIVMYGYGPVGRALLKAGLLDELRLVIHPIFGGRGGPEQLIFAEDETTPVKLLDTKVFDNGVIVATYGPA